MPILVSPLLTIDDPEKMKQKGIMAFYSDAGISLMDILTIVFSCEGETARMGIYQKEEFVRAFQALGVSSVSDLAKKKDKIRSKYTSDHDLFKKVYKFAFPYASMGKKELKRAIAVQILTVLLKDRYPLSEKFLIFLKDHVRRLFYLLV